jgi:uncharacterized protein YjbI with pentapeptide repeats
MTQPTITVVADAIANHGLWRYGEPGGTRANLARMDLTGMDLTGVDLAAANLGAVNLARATLTGGSFGGASFNGADLRDADASNAWFVAADFTAADLRGANFGGSKLSHANFHHTYLRGTDLTGADLNGASFAGAFIAGAVGLAAWYQGGCFGPWNHQVQVFHRGDAGIEVHTPHFSGSAEQVAEELTRQRAQWAKEIGVSAASEDLADALEQIRIGVGSVTRRSGRSR